MNYNYYLVRPSIDDEKYINNFTENEIIAIGLNFTLFFGHSIKQIIFFHIQPESYNSTRYVSVFDCKNILYS